MPGKKVPPLSSLAPRKEDTSIPVTPGSSAFPPSSFRPKLLTLVLSDGASIADVNKALEQWSEQGFGKKLGAGAGASAQDVANLKPEQIPAAAAAAVTAGGGGDVTARLSALVYELPKGQSVESIKDIAIANKAPNNLPITTIVPLTEPVLPTPASTNPEPLALSYRLTLPPLSKSLKPTSDGQPSAYLDFLAQASAKDYLVELDLAPAGDVRTGEEKGLESRRDEVEELLGKSYEKEVGPGGAAAGEEEQEEILDGADGEAPEAHKHAHGIKIVLNGLGGPPNISSSDLLRSEALESWSGFISRMALHPRVYLKLSPLDFPSVLPLPSPSTASNPLASAALSAAHNVANAAASAADSLLSATSPGPQSATSPTSLSASSYIERRIELRRRLRTILGLAYEAFGEDRILWATGLAGCGVKPSKGSVEDGKNALEKRGDEIEIVGEDGGGGVSPSASTASLATPGAGGAASPAAASAAAPVREELSAAEEWYELCRETFQQLGLGDESLDKIFCVNAQDVYRI